MSGALNTNISSIPQILQQPADVTTVAGGAATFTVFAASTTNLNYQWYEGDWLAIPGATNATLTLTGVNYLDVDTYSVTVTGGNGQSVDSLRATLRSGRRSHSTNWSRCFGSSTNPAKRNWRN